MLPVDITRFDPLRTFIIKIFDKVIEYTQNNSMFSRKGIANIGNTCYMASVLQFLVRCRCFQEYILPQVDEDKKDKKDENNKKYLRPDENIIKALQNNNTDDSRRPNLIVALHHLYAELFDYDEKAYAIDPYKFCRALKRKHPEWVTLQQNDAHEFYMLLMNSLIQETGRRIISKNVNFATYPPIKSRTSLLTASRPSEAAVHNRGEEHWKNEMSSCYSGLSEYFCGQYISQMKCLSCGHTSHTFEIMSAIPLSCDSSTDGNGNPLPLSVKQYLQKFFSDERIEGWKCERCCTTPSKGALKTYRIWKMPRVLVIMFVHRQSSMSGRRSCKILPDETIDIHKFCVGPLARQARSRSHDVYSIRSVVCHSGKSIDSGHYFCVAPMPGGGGRWCVYDDDLIYLRNDLFTQTSSSEKIYMLSYEYEYEYDSNH